MTKMMSLSDKEAVYATKEEGEKTNNNNTSTAAAASSSRQWSSGLKNPRIVRVSRTFGGKDRHSKVCTIKGLRDRRIRLSVPTAIQLYDLQDRLGLSQPSKVIDWLLDTTKHDIDKLPPLPPMPGSFMQFQQPIHHATSQGYGAPFININSAHQSVDVNEDPSIVAKLKYWDSSSNNSLMRSKQKEIDIDNDDQQEAIGDSQVSAQNFFPIASGSNNSSASILPPSTLLSNHPMHNYYYHWDPSSNLSLTQLGSSSLGGGISSHNNNGNNSSNNNNSSSLPSQLALSSSGAQLFLSPSMTSSSTFPQHTSFTHHHHHHHQVESTNDDIRQFNNRFNLLNSNQFPSSLYSSSSGLGLKPFPLSMSHLAHLHQSHDHQHRENKDDNDNDNDGPWKRS